MIAAEAVAIAICPCCGHDMRLDVPILIDDFSMLSRLSPLCYRGVAVRLTPAMRDLCWAMMKSFPRPINKDVLLIRLDSESECNVIDVYLSRIRKALIAAGAPIPFAAVRSRRWSGDPAAVVWQRVDDPIVQMARFQ